MYIVVESKFQLGDWEKLKDMNGINYKNYKMYELHICKIIQYHAK